MVPTVDSVNAQYLLHFQTLPLSYIEAQLAGNNVMAAGPTSYQAWQPQYNPAMGAISSGSVPLVVVK